MTEEGTDSVFKPVREKVEKAHQDSVSDVRDKVERAKSEALKKFHS